MNVAWFLIFNCMMVPGTISGALGEKEQLTSSNLVQHLEKPYKTEQRCLKDAYKGAKNVLPAHEDCYFVCVKGFSGKGQK